MRATVLVMCVSLVLFTSGCKTPPGLKYNVSGLQAAPFGNSPDAPKLTVGIMSFDLPGDKADEPPELNRVQIRGMGFNHVNTISRGAMGEQIGKAGGVLPESLEELHGPQTDAATETEHFLEPAHHAAGRFGHTDFGERSVSRTEKSAPRPRRTPLRLLSP